MDVFVAWFTLLGAFGLVMAAFVWLGKRARRRGGGGSGEAVMGPFEEIWHPAAHRARLETLIVEERVVSMPSPDDHWPRKRDAAN